MRFICTSIMATLMLAGTSFADTHTVLANSTSFSPDAIDVAPGDTIVWQYNSGYPHTVTSGVPCTADGWFYSELHSGNPTFTWEVPPDASGDIFYFCEPHCNMGMDGIITVVGPADCPGDLDGNGEVSVDDLLAILAAYQTNADGDCDGDGDTDVDDLLIVISAWGVCP